MTLKILRMDQQEETRAAEITPHWQRWAINNGYRPKQSIPVEQGKMRITLEVWQNPTATEDAYLFYHEGIPSTNDTEVLYIINDQDRLERIIAISQHMASDLMRRVQNLAKTMQGSEPEI